MPLLQRFALLIWKSYLSGQDRQVLAESSILADFRLSLFDGKFYVKRKPLPEHLTQHQQKVFISTALSLVFKYFLSLSCLCSKEKGCLQEKGGDTVCYRLLNPLLFLKKLEKV